MKREIIYKVFEEKYGIDYRIFKAPGRINLIGEHTDYNYGFVTPAAINRYITLAISPNVENKYRIHSLDFNENIEIFPEDDFKEIASWAKYPLGVIKEIENLGYEIPGFDAVFSGDIPEGAGLSSSAALEMAFAVAFNNIFELDLDKNTIAKVGQLAEHNTVGVKCGIMDQFASLFGQKNKLIHLDCLDNSFVMIPFDIKENSLILTDTKVKHSLASSEYNRRREECEEGVRILAKKFPEVKSLRDVDLKMIDATMNNANPLVIKRCEYVVEENQRVRDTVEALEKDDFAGIGKLLYESHYGLRNKYEVSCAELDFLVKTAKTIPGVLGARMMGGGFGGCTINLLKSESIEHFKNSISMLYSKQFNYAPEFYELEISDGAGEA